MIPFPKTIETNIIAKILYIFQRHKDVIYKDKDDLPKTKTTLQRQRQPKDVPKTEALREDAKDADAKDADAKDKSDVFLMMTNVSNYYIKLQLHTV